MDVNAHIMGFFTRNEDELQALIEPLVDDPHSAIAEARAIYASFIPDSAYTDDLNNVFATALFFCNVNLAVYLALKAHGVDVHTYGVALLEHLQRSTPPPENTTDGTRPKFAGPGTHPGEFEVEIVKGGSHTDFDWGYNIKSCAICYQFARHDAMELVPYMCASDDVVSDAGDQGLRRIGTIALGAHQCDFRYRTGGEPKRLAEQYPQRIKVAMKN